MKTTAEEFFRNHLKELYPEKTEITLSQKQISVEKAIFLAHSYYLLKNAENICEWKYMDFGMMGFSSYEYVTTCGKNYDCDKIRKENYCPNCGGKIV